LVILVSLQTPGFSASPGTSLNEFACDFPTCVLGISARLIADHHRSANVDRRGGSGGATRRASYAKGSFFNFFPHNPLKRPNSAKEKQGNASFFPCFSLVFLAGNST
jgi:hypothetical protein